MPSSFPGGENRSHCGPLRLPSASPQPVPAQGLILLQGYFMMQSKHLVLLDLKNVQAENSVLLTSFESNYQIVNDLIRS